MLARSLIWIPESVILPKIYDELIPSLFQQAGQVSFDISLSYPSPNSFDLHSFEKKVAF